MTITGFFHRLSELYDKIGKEYAYVSALVQSVVTPEEIAARTAVLDDIATTAKDAFDSFNAGRYSQAQKRLTEAQRAYADLDRLVLRRIERQRERESSPASFVDAALAGSVVGW